MPTIFIGHGNPMNALNCNAWTAGWAAFGSSIPRPRAVLCVSAHWYIPATMVTAMVAPRTIHDFGGFPRELFEVQYNAPGDPALAHLVQQLLLPVAVGLDNQWGLDHGTWSVLRHVFPQADVPVIQLSLDATQPARYHYEIARRLSSLRDDGVLILGSGNLVHNLQAYDWNRQQTGPLDWALRFEAHARALLLEGEHDPLIAYETLGQDAKLSASTPEHYLPLLYVIAQQRPGEPVSFPVEGFDGGSISMLSVQVGM